jgi:hypothetical protein
MQLKNQVPLFIILIFLLFKCSLSAQSQPKFGVKLAWLTNVNPQNLLLGIEYRFKPKSSFLMNFTYLHHNQQPIDLYNGKISVSYSSLRSTRKYIDKNEPEIIGDWVIISSTRPFKNYPTQYALYTYDFNLGYGSTLDLGKSRWNIVLQPSIRGALHSFYQNDNQLNIIEDEFAEIISGQYPNTIKESRQVITYKQSREMKITSKWVFGVNYDLGLRRFWTQRLQTTFNIGAGLNFTHPYKDNLPQTLKSSWWGGRLEVGYYF